MQKYGSLCQYQRSYTYLKKNIDAFDRDKVELFEDYSVSF